MNKNIKTLEVMETMVQQVQTVGNADELQQFVELLNLVCYQNWDGSAEVDLHDDGRLSIRLYNEDGDAESEYQACPQAGGRLYEFRSASETDRPCVLLPLVPSAIVGFMIL